MAAKLKSLPQHLLQRLLAGCRTDDERAAVELQWWTYCQMLSVGDGKAAVAVLKDITRSLRASAAPAPQKHEVSVTAPMFAQGAEAIRARLASVLASMPNAAPAPPVGDSTLPAPPGPPPSKNEPGAT